MRRLRMVPDNSAQCGGSKANLILKWPRREPATKTMTFTRPPYKKITLREIRAQPLTAGEREMLQIINVNDHGDGCYKLNSTLAKELMTTVPAIRCRINRLKKKGYIALMGFTSLGQAIRRVTLTHGVKDVAGGGAFMFTPDGKGFRYRRSDEPNPAIFALKDEVSPSRLGEIPPSRLGETQRIRNEDIKEYPVVPFQEKGPSEFFSVPDPTSSQPTTNTPASDGQPRHPAARRRNPFNVGAVPQQNHAPVTADTHNQPATPAPRDGRTKDWVGMFNQLSFATAMQAKFGNISPGVARSCVKRIRRRTWHEAGVLFVLNNLAKLPEHGRPTTAEKFVSNFEAAVEYLVKHETRVRLNLAQRQHENLTGPANNADSDYCAHTLGAMVKPWCQALDAKRAGKSVPVTPALLWSCVETPGCYSFAESKFGVDMQDITGFTLEEMFGNKAVLVEHLHFELLAGKSLTLDELLERESHTVTGLLQDLIDEKQDLLSETAAEATN